MFREEIKKRTGHAIYTPIYELKPGDDGTLLSPPWKYQSVITSLDSYVYGKQSMPSWFRKYEDDLPGIHRRFRLGCPTKSDIGMFDEMDKIIDLSPGAPFELTLWRGLFFEKGIPSEFLEKGNVISHKTIVWTTIDSSYARFFLHDTRECYKGGLNQVKETSSRKQSILMKIKIPSRTKYLEIPYPFDLAISGCQITAPEILLKSDTCLQIEEVILEEKNTLIHVKIL